ncbi:hypothetical protein DEIPH_ctg076orf0021 [Deinococcus phoenicis]|uniref:Group 1 glycosyl transferase n=1 Tax=Deinococcus phoenicis TaxID=1476583 RepID=A0A016QL89_9DEIO|nr:glycosyltransferase family 4 protein [Deinococcus phoenicis]EYB66761.1 hypothetical protein DEIPH_ctg076orf0021 [Deinococcus phoenicis]
MKILHILNEFREIGNGIVNVATDLACLQSREGHQVLVASSGGEYEHLLLDYGGRHVRLDQRRRPLELARAALKWREIVHEFEPDIVHAHMMTGVMLARLLRGSAPYRIVTTVHNEFQRSADLMRYGDRVVAVSEAVGEAMVRRGTPRHNLRVVLNGTLGSPRRVPLENLTPAELKRPAIVTVGAVSERKGSDLLIEAFRRVAPAHPEAQLYFVGGRDWPAAEELARASGVGGRIHFVGFEPQPQRYLLGADIFAFPSRQEPFGLVLLEAREAGLPIVASDVDGIPEALSGGRAGLLIPPADPTSLAAALDSLLSSAAQREEWTARARLGIEAFSVERMHREYLNVYREVLEA